MEEIVGEIVDESDEEEEIGLEMVDDHTVDVDGRFMIDDLNEILDWNMPESDDYETVAGFVLYHLGSIPEPGQQLTVGETEIEILKASNRKIDSMRIRRIGMKDQKVG